MGGADLKDINEITKKPRLDNSPAMKLAADRALHQAGISLEEIDKFDFYSCFPSIVEIMMNELGLTINDSRDLTLTGGLPFFGGPWSNYSMHAIVTAIEHIRVDSRLKIMVIANGGYNTKKSVGIYGSQPPQIPWTDRDDTELQQTILKGALPEPIKQTKGMLTVEAYTIPYNRSGDLQEAIILGRLEDGTKTLALLIPSSKILLKLENEEFVGKKCQVNFDSDLQRNIATFLE